MSSYVLETITNIHDPRLERFRERVCVENGADSDYSQQDINYTGTLKRYGHLEKSAFEEVWRFGLNKWKSANFSSVEVALCPETGEVVSISGARRYSMGMMRVGMHLYTLKDYRRKIRNIQFSANGFFHRHVQAAHLEADVECLFMTVYPYNNKLKTHALNLGRRRMSPDGGEMSYIHDLQFFDETFLFHHVEQYFFLYRMNPNFVWNKKVPEPL